MKRVLLLGIILAILILAMPQGVLAAPSTTQPATVTASINPYMDLTITAPPTGWKLASGDATTGAGNNFFNEMSSQYPIVLKVETNFAWDVKANDNGATAKGHMIASNTNVALKDPMFITTAAGADPAASWTALSNGDITIASSATRPPTAFVDILRNLKQQVYSTDPTENPYSITITFTASNPGT